jgi:23S rRNA pseudouridine1911/1915/1917 synthase
MQIVFEDNYLLALNKTAGLSAESGKASHPSAEREALAYCTRQLQEKSGSSLFKASPYLRAVHRLDRASSGVLLFAKSKTALTYLMQQFERREVEKTYRAIVEKQPPATFGLLSHWLKKDVDGRKALVADKQTSDSQHCELEYKVLEVKEKNCVLELRPLTGRFHQIRAQLAHISCPIVGDTLYGGHFWKENEIKLHASRLKFRHPQTEVWMELETLPGEGW